MTYRTVVVLACLAAFPVHAQDSENPPTLKLDRIPSMPAFQGQTRAPAAPASDFRVETVVDGLFTPWALAFLPDGEILISEYTSGDLRIVTKDGELTAPVSGLPDISHEGWAGLFDVTLDPDYERNRTLYFSYTAPSGNAESPNIPRVSRARLDRACCLLGARVCPHNRRRRIRSTAGMGTAATLKASWQLQADTQPRPRRVIRPPQNRLLCRRGTTPEFARRLFPIENTEDSLEHIHFREKFEEVVEQILERYFFFNS